VKRLVLAVLLVAAPSVAAADSWPPGAAPPGTNASPDQSARLGRDLAGEGHFGGAALAPDSTSVNVFIGHGASLLAWRVATAGPVADPAAAAKAELDQVRGAVRAAASDGSKTEETAWSERVVPASNTVEAELAWRHRDLGTTRRTRVVLSATAKGMEAVAGECTMRDDVVAAFDAKCTAFLAEVAPTTPVADRIALVIGGDPANAAAGSGDVGSAPASGGGPTLTAPVGPLPPVTIPATRPPPKKPDLRALYVAGGLLVLIAVFLWNRSKRKEMEEEYGKTQPRRRWRKVGDEDADALAGAAEGADEGEGEGEADTAGDGDGEAEKAGEGEADEDQVAAAPAPGDEDAAPDDDGKAKEPEA